MSPLPSLHHRIRVATLWLTCLASTFVGTCLWVQSVVADEAADKQPEVEILYVPSEDLPSFINRKNPGVLVPHEKFMELWKQAYGQSKSDPSSNPLHITHVDYQARVQGKQLQVTAKCQLKGKHEDWGRLQFELSGWQIESAKIGDDPALMTSLSVPRPDLLPQLEGAVNLPIPAIPEYHIIAKLDGETTLTLELSQPLEISSDRLSARCSLLMAPSATMSIEVPEGMTVTIPRHDQTPTLTFPPEEGQDDKDNRTYQITLGTRDHVVLEFGRDAAARKQTAISLAESSIGIHFSPAGASWLSNTRLEFPGQEKLEITCQLPENLDVVGVESSSLASWSVSEDHQLTLHFRQPRVDVCTFQIRGILGTTFDDESNQQSLSLSGFVFDEVVSHTGVIRFQTPEDARLVFVDTTGLHPETPERASQEAKSSPNLPIQTPVDPNELTDLVYWRQDYLLDATLSVKPRTVYVAQTTVLDLTETQASLRAVADIKTLFAPLFNIEVSVPKEWQVNEVKLNNVNTAWRSREQENGNQRLMIDLPSPLGVAQSIQLIIKAEPGVLNWPPENDEAVELTLPTLTIQNVDVLEGAYGITGSSDLEIVTSEMTGLSPASLGLSSERFGFRYQQPEISGKLSVKFKNAHISAMLLSVYRLEKQTLDAFYETSLSIQQRGVQQIDVQLPESAGTDVRFQTSDPSLVIQQQSPGPIERGRRSFTLTFNRRFQGDVKLMAHVRLPKPNLGERSEVDLPQLTIPSANRFWGYLVLLADDDQQLTLTAVDSQNVPLSLVDRIELPSSPLIGQSRVVSAVRFTTVGAKAEVSEERFNRVSLPSAICTKATLNTVLEPQQQAQHHAHYDLKASGVQSLKAQLPESAQVWSILLNGSPVESRQVAGGLLIPLVAANLSSTESFTLDLYYATPQGDGNLNSLALGYDAIGPLLHVVDGEGTSQPLEVLSEQWTLHTPDSYQLSNGDGDFHLSTQQTHPRNLFERLRWMLDPHRSKDFLWRGAGLGVVLFVALVVLPWIVRMFQTRTPSKLLAGCLAIFFFILFIMIMMPAVQQPREAARRSQLKQQARELSMTMEDMSDSMSSGVISEAPASAPFDFPLDGDFDGVKARDAESKKDSNVSDFAIYQDPSQQTRGDLQGDLNGDGRIPAAEFESMQPEQKPNANLGMGMQTGEFQAGQPTPWGMPITQTPIGQPGPAVTPDPAQPPVPQQPIEQPPQTVGFVVGGVGGLLSIPITLQVPEHYLSHEFSYDGIKSTSEPVVLKARLHNLLLLRVLLAIVLAGTALLLWILRRLPLQSRLAILFTGLTVPLALAVFDSPLLTSISLGLFFGTILSSVLWICAAALGKIRRSLFSLSKHHRTAAASVLLTTIATLSSSSLLAQEQPASALEEACRAQPGVTQIIVPYDPSLGLDPKINQVYLPREEFLKLHQAATQAIDLSPAPGVRYSILQTAYNIPLTDAAKSNGQGIRDGFLINGRILIHVFDKSVSETSPLEIALPIEQAKLVSATLDDQPATIRLDADGRKMLLMLSSPGTHILDLTATIDGRMDAAGAQLNAFFAPVTSGVLTISLPKEKYNVRINQQDNTFRMTNDGDAELYHIGIARGGPLTVTLEPRRDQAEKRRIVDAEGFHQYRLKEALLELTTTYRIQVRQGELLEMPIQLSEGLMLKSISGADLAGWQFEEGSTQGTLYFRRAIADQTQIALTSYFLLPQDDQFTLELPTVDLPGVTRETGRWLLLEHDYLKIKRVDQLTGLTQVEYDARFWPGDVQSSRSRIFSCYRYVSKPTGATLTLERQISSYDVKAMHGVMVQKDRVKLATSMTVDVGQMPTRQLTLSLPFGALVLDANAELLDDWVVDPDFGELQLFFTTPRSGKIVLNLELQIVRNVSEMIVALDLPRVSGAQSQESYVAFWLQGGYSGVMLAYDGWTPISPQDLPGEMKSLSSGTASFAFRTRLTEPDFVTLSLQQAPLVASCDGLVLTAVSDTSVDHGLTLRWQIRQSATDQLDCLVSSDLTEALEWNGAGIREIRQTAGPQGKTRWTILLHQPVSSDYVLSGTASLPYPQDQTVKMPKVEFIQQQVDDPTKFTSITSQMTFGVLVNLSDDQVLPLRPDLLETIPAEELTLKVQPELIKQASEILRLRPQTEELSWQVRRGVLQRATEASVNDAALVTDLSSDGSWRTTATYTIKNISRQFLALQLPPDSTLLSIQVEGKPSRAVQTTLEERSVILVPLPATSEADLSFEVKVITQGRLEKPLPKGNEPGWKDLSIPVLQVVTPEQSAQFGIPVAYTRWNLTLPGGYTATVVRNPDRTNLVETTLASSQAKYLSGLLAEFDEFNRYASDLGVSSKLRSTAVDNQKELADRINRAQVELLGKGMSKEETKEASELQSKLGQSFQAYGRNVNEYAQQSRQQVSQEGAKPSSGRGLVEMNNTYIVTQNADTNTNRSESGSFRFRIADEAKIEDLKSHTIRNGKDVLSERSKLSSNFARQNSLLNESVDQPSSSSISKAVPEGINRPTDSLGIQRRELSDFSAWSMGGNGSGNGQNLGGALGGGGLGGEIPLDGNLFRKDFGTEELESGREKIFFDFQAPQAAGTAKGLSFLIDLPKENPSLSLIKVGGQPQLTIQVRTAATMGTGIKAVWFVTLLISLVLMLMGIRDLDHSGVIPAKTRLGLMLMGILLVVLTNGTLMALGFILLVAVVILQLRAMLVERLSLSA